MNDDGILGGVLNQLGQTAKKTVQQVVKLPAASAEGFGPLRQSSSEASEPKEEKKQQWKSDEERVKFLRDLYGKKDMSKDGSSDLSASSGQGKKPTEFEAQIKDKPSDEQKKLMELRQQLHKQNYYDPTFNPVKKQEERPAEKVENEKKIEMQDLQKKEEEKPPPLAVVREQNKTEMFRGAAG